MKPHAQVAVQTMDIPNGHSVANSTTTTLEGNKKTTNMIRESPTKRIVYRHLNQKSGGL